MNIYEERKLDRLRRYNKSRKTNQRRHVYIAVILAFIWGLALGSSTFKSPIILEAIKAGVFEEVKP